MEINEVIIKHYLKNVMFINGTAYAGKSTMAAMLAERYGLILCGENYHAKVAEKLATPDKYPNTSYFKTMKSWQEFLNRTPEEYANWIDGVAAEVAEFEIAELLHISQNKKVVVDTNLSIDILKKIAGYNQVAIMLSPQEMSANEFFNRDDEDKKFLLSKINEAENPEKTMQNFRKCLEKIHSEENYNKMANSGFFTLVRENADIDTKEETLNTLARHFGLQ